MSSVQVRSKSSGVRSLEKNEGSVTENLLKVQQDSPLSPRRREGRKERRDGDKVKERQKVLEDDEDNLPSFVFICSKQDYLALKRVVQDHQKDPGTRPANPDLLCSTPIRSGFLLPEDKN